MTEKSLRVLIAEKDVGQILQRPSGSYRFEYLPEWQANPRHIPLSRSLPLQQQRHNAKPITNFMWGLLPDNARTLDEWSKRFQVSARNPFALLTLVGEDCPGAVQLVSPDIDLAGRENVTRLTKKDLEDRINALKADAGAGRLATDTGQFSLAGAQAKTAFYKTKSSWAIPQGRTPTTHIFKPESGRIPNIASNEHFCLELARRLDLPAALSTVEVIGGAPVIIVERYDRLRGPKGVVRVHQEDMCQALGVDPMRKYQADGGPTIKQIMDLLRESANPDVDRDRFMRAQALNFIIAGTDAHARNYSIVYAPGGAFRLAPLYDVISDLPYAADRRESSLAMGVGGQRVLREILPRHWEVLSADAGYARGRGLAHVRDLIARAPDEAEALLADLKLKGLHNATLTRLCKELRARCRGLAPIYGSEVLPPKTSN
ncbi:MAG: type II toxin-antitoxin system HipA family toxin [Alphaproteobacteria bacterium]|nr:type II toxin-antitoxin system HipA family toxin [Alphaproteobacteria bacterium]